MPRPGSKRKVPPKRVSNEGIAQSNVTRVFMKGLKEANHFFDLRIISLEELTNYKHFLNQEFASHLQSAKNGDLISAQTFLDKIIKHRSRKLSLPILLEVELEELMPKASGSKNIRKSTVKQRPGIRTKAELEKAITARKKDLRMARVYRRFANGQIVERISSQTGISRGTVKRYLLEETKRRGVNFSEIADRNMKKDLDAKKRAKAKGRVKTQAEVSDAQRAEIKRVVAKAGGEKGPKKVVYAIPTKDGSELASNQAVGFTREIAELERAYYSPNVSDVIIARDKVRNLKRRRQILNDYMGGKLDASHKVARFLTGYKKKKE